MTIELNGAPVELPDGASVADAVERGGRRRRSGAGSRSPSTARWFRGRSGSATELRDGQTVEVVRAVQGG